MEWIEIIETTVAIAFFCAFFVGFVCFGFWIIPLIYDRITAKRKRVVWGLLGGSKAFEIGRGTVVEIQLLLPPDRKEEAISAVEEIDRLYPAIAELVVFPSKKAG